MHFMRVVSALTIFCVAVFYSNKLLGIFQLNDIMTTDEQQKTGISQLSEAQKKELETWLNSKFVLKTSSSPDNSPLYLQQNIQNGSQLMLSNGSLYEIAPTDRAKTLFWLTPIEIKIESSDDPLYPAKLTNALTGVSVKAKPLQTSSSP